MFVLFLMHRILEDSKKVNVNGIEISQKKRVEIENKFKNFNSI